MNLEVDIQLKRGAFTLETAFRCEESALGVFGPSGCGKSTLFRVIAGLIKPNAGRVVLDGEPLFDSERRLFVPPHRRGVGLVFQDARLFPHWNVERNLRAGENARKNAPTRPFSFDDVVDLLDIARLVHRAVDELSGGERQRVAIGRALLSNPRLLLLDEPVTGLDVSLKTQILPFLSRVHEQLNMPTLLISHDLGEILQLTNRLLLLRDGRARGYGDLDQLAENPDTLKELKGAELTNLISADVLEHDRSRGTTLLSVGDQRVSMELSEDLDVGARINIGVSAHQIALASRRVEGISMRNQLPGRVAKIVHAADRSICHVETAAGVLLAEITPGTERDLELREGVETHALFKSMAVQPL